MSSGIYRTFDGVYKVNSLHVIPHRSSSRKSTKFLRKAKKNKKARTFALKSKAYINIPVACARRCRACARARARVITAVKWREPAN